MHCGQKCTLTLALIFLSVITTSFSENHEAQIRSQQQSADDESTKLSKQPEGSNTETGIGQSDKQQSKQSDIPSQVKPLQQQTQSLPVQPADSHSQHASINTADTLPHKPSSSQEKFKQELDESHDLKLNINAAQKEEPLSGNVGLMFEEVGDADDNLVEQVKRLSEKIKNGKATVMQFDEVQIEPEKETKIDETKQSVEHIQQPTIHIRPKRKVNEETVLEKIKKLEETLPEMNLEELQVQEEGMFPDDSYDIDYSGKTQELKNIQTGFHNTNPPADKSPPKTESNNKITMEPIAPLMADKTVETLKPTPTMPQSLETASFATTQIETKDNFKTPVAKQETQSVIREKPVAPEVTIANPATASSSSTREVRAVNIEPSQTLNQYEATVHSTDTPHASSIVKTASVPTGDVYQTAIQQSVNVDKAHHEKPQVHNVVPTTVPATAVVKEVTDMPAMTESVHEQTPSPRDVPVPSQQPSTPNKEETEEEKLIREKSQEYFEEGEKLVNNSYKKDHLQAYQYFKLAADLGHERALEYMGFGHLLGDYINLDPKQALKIFSDLSAKGLPRGQLGLGFSYSAGLAVNSSQAKALIYFTFSALGGDPLAQMVLGYRYLSGIGVESKCETALQYYRKVATTVAENTSSGSPMIQRIRLHEQVEQKDSTANLMDDDLLQYYQFLADKGDVQAQVVLGQLFYQGGRGVPINHERAHYYFMMAAESANANAFAFLGKMHSEGSPVVQQDNLSALQYFKKAADKGNPVGQCGLGILYLYGKGVEKDYAKAFKYFTASAEQGWSDAQLHLGIMHFSGKGVRRDYKMAVKYFNLASQGGHVLAFYHLAQMHATGTGVLRNCHTAVELYKNVAERGSWSSMLMEAHQLYKEGSVDEALLKYTFLAELGYEVAQTNVAYILDQGECHLFDEQETYQRALLHWTRAAAQGSTVARLKMGDYHYYGYGTDIDYETAASHYRLATEQQHNAQAMFNLGYMHEQGLGLKQDVHLAKRFYDMAAETSGDAYIPVTLALLKLGLFYGSEIFNKELESYYQFLNKLDVRYLLGPDWDVYVATFLAVILGIIIVVRRQR